MLNLEKDRQLYLERKERALAEAIEAERVLERIKSDCEQFESMKRAREKSVYELQEKMNTLQTECQARVHDIETTKRQHDEIKQRHIEDLESIKAQIRLAEIHREGLNKDIVQIQNSINTARQAEAKLDEELKERGRFLTHVLRSIEEEQQRLQDIISLQSTEKKDLLDQKAMIDRANAEHAKKQEELYRLRDDLTILAERYAQFARDHNLPFTI